MDPNSPEALAQALMGQQQPDPYENMHGTGPQGNVANSLLGSAQQWWDNQPSFASKIHDQTTQDQQALAQGGVKGMLAQDPSRSLDVAGGFAGIMAGPLSKTADLAGLATAKQLAAQGAPRDHILQQTGWFLGNEGKWKYEISDNTSSIKPGFPGPPNWRGTVGDKLDHPDLFQAYPDLAGIQTQYGGNLEGSGYLPKRLMPSMLRQHLPEQMRFPPQNQWETPQGMWDNHDSMLHELQHAVQEREGFAPGADDFLANHADLVRAGANQDMSVDAIQRAAHDVYRRSAGEVEARNTAYRQQFTSAQRRFDYPWDTEDVPTHEQIFGQPTLQHYIDALNRQK